MKTVNSILNTAENQTREDPGRKLKKAKGDKGAKRKSLG